MKKIDSIFVLPLLHLLCPIRGWNDVTLDLNRLVILFLDNGLLGR